MRSTFTSMAKVSELFNKVDELDSPAEDYNPNMSHMNMTDMFAKASKLVD